MKIKDLAKYKTLDITQLSGSPWNTAEKVLGLDSGDTVVMVNRTDDEAKQYTDDAIASALTSYYTKDEVDEIVEDIDVTEQLTNYYTKQEVDAANDVQDERIENNENDIADLQSGMVSKSEFETAMADETARTESTYAKPSDIPDLTPYATESYVDAAIQAETARTESTYLKEHQSLENYYTKSQVDTLIEDIDVSDQLANYALSSSVTEDINTAIANETARTESVYAKKSEIPSLENYATEAYVDNAIEAETARTESTYLKEHQSLDNYYTKAQVDSAITRVEEEIPLVPVNVSAFVNDAGYLTEHQSLAGLFNSASYDSETKRINFYDKSNVLSSYIDATAFIKDGMVERVYITGSTLVVSFNTDAGTEDIELDLTDVFDPANYYTKGQVDAFMTNETARTENVYAKKSEIPSLNGYATEAWVEGKGYITGVTVDAELTSASTNAVQSKVIYKALNGESITTELTVLDTDSDWKMYADRVMYNFKNTSIDKYKVLYLGDLGLSTRGIYLRIVDNNGTIFKSLPSNSVATALVGIQKWYLVDDGVDIQFIPNYVDGTYEYYLFLDTERKYWMVYKTLPKSFTEVTDHKANISDIPTAQDGSDFKQYVYNSEDDFRKKVLRSASVSPTITRTGTPTTDTFDLKIRNDLYYWNKNSVASRENVLNYGNVYNPGIKTVKDSKIINKADQALDGFTEQITLTIGAQSTDYIDASHYFSETNDPRYLVYRTTGHISIREMYLSGVRYVVKNPPFGNIGISFNGIYQIVEAPAEYVQVQSVLITQVDKYIIIDKELLTFEVADSLTITRAKNIQEAFDNIPAPDMSNYYTKSEVDAEITGATQDMATRTWVGEQGYLTQHQDISGKLDVSTFNTYTGATETVLEGKADISDIPDVSGFVTSGDVETQIGTAMATETARTESTYLKEHQDISSKLDVSVFTGYTGTTETALNGKVDLATYTAYTGSTATAIAGKQDTLVSGTNIKTINNQSLLGSGNIDIQGGGGGGSVVELTKAQYEALDPPAADTTYIITDADVVDLNDYAMASGLTKLSGTVETISSNYATKQNVTARASGYYWPRWNNQGVITGEYRYYVKQQGINGSNYSVIADSSTDHPSIFAPTSAGTAGQPLLSNGSGAPVWGGYKFAFMSQSQYDALTTPDSTTIYFIVDPN